MWWNYPGFLHFRKLLFCVCFLHITLLWRSKFAYYCHQYKIFSLLPKHKSYILFIGFKKVFFIKLFLQRRLKETLWKFHYSKIIWAFNTSENFCFDVQMSRLTWGIVVHTRLEDKFTFINYEILVFSKQGKYQIKCHKPSRVFLFVFLKQKFLHKNAHCDNSLNSSHWDVS